MFPRYWLRNMSLYLKSDEKSRFDYLQRYMTNPRQNFVINLTQKSANCFCNQKTFYFGQNLNEKNNKILS